MTSKPQPLLRGKPTRPVSTTKSPKLKPGPITIKRDTGVKINREDDFIKLKGDDRPTRVVNVSLKNLRSEGYETINEWLEDPNHIYIGKSNRFVGLSSSIWANPFPVTEEVPVEDSLKFYKAHIIESGLIDKIDELRGKDLGCWCNEGNCICHGHVLLQLLREKEDTNRKTKPLSAKKEMEILESIEDQISRKIGEDDLFISDGNPLEDFLEDQESEDLIVSVSRDYVPDVRTMKAKSSRTHIQETFLADDDIKDFREMNTLERKITKKNNDKTVEILKSKNKEKDDDYQDQENYNEGGPSYEPPREGLDEELGRIYSKVSELFPKLTETRKNMITRASFNYLIYGSSYDPILMEYIRKVSGQKKK